MKIKIEVKGGCVVKISASEPELCKVILVDWDNIEEREATEPREPNFYVDQLKE